MTNTKHHNAPNGLDSAGRRRVMRLLGAAGLLWPVSRASSNPFSGTAEIVVTRWVCEQIFPVGRDYSTGETERNKMVSLIGSASDDIESALTSLNNTNNRYPGNDELSSRWVRLGPASASTELPTAFLGLIVLRDCSQKSLQLLVAEANRYRQQGVEIYLAFDDTPEAARAVQAAMAEFSGAWRRFRMGRVVDEGVITTLDGLAAQMIAFLEVLHVPVGNFNFPGICHQDALEVYVTQDVYVTRLRSGSFAGVKELLAEERKRHAPDDGFLLTAYLSADMRRRLRDTFDIMDLHHTVRCDEAPQIYAVTWDRGRRHFDIYLSGCHSC